MLLHNPDSAGRIQWLYFNDSFGGGRGWDLIFKDGQVFLGGVTGTGHMVVICVDTSGQELWSWVDTVFYSEGFAGTSPKVVYEYNHLNSFVNGTIC